MIWVANAMLVAIADPHPTPAYVLSRPHVNLRSVLSGCIFHAAAGPPAKKVNEEYAANAGYLEAERWRKDAEETPVTQSERPTRRYIHFCLRHAVKWTCVSVVHISF